MISVNVLVDHNKWKKSLNKPQLFFDKILKRFPKKYFYSNKNVKDIKFIKKKLYGGKLKDETPPSKNRIKKFSFSDFVKSLTY